jgi:hypothetical protein
MEKKIISADTHLKALALFVLAHRHSVEAARIEHVLSEVFGLPEKDYLGHLSGRNCFLSANVPVAVDLGGRSPLRKALSYVAANLRRSVKPFFATAHESPPLACTNGRHALCLRRDARNSLAQPNVRRVFVVRGVPQQRNFELR